LARRDLPDERAARGRVYRPQKPGGGRSRRRGVHGDPGCIDAKKRLSEVSKDDNGVPAPYGQAEGLVALVDVHRGGCSQWGTQWKDSRSEIDGDDARPDVSTRRGRCREGHENNKRKEDGEYPNRKGAQASAHRSARDAAAEPREQ
jgi:hypothetical protein